MNGYRGERFNRTYLGFAHVARLYRRLERACDCVRARREGRIAEEGRRACRRWEQYITLARARLSASSTLFPSPTRVLTALVLPPPTLERVGLPRSSPSVYHYIHASRAATRQHTDLFPLSGTQPRRVTSLRWMPAERRNTGREWRRRRRRKGYREKIATREMLHEAAPRWGRSIQWLVISQRDFRGNGQLCYARQGMIHTPLRLGKLEEMLLLFTEMYLERNCLVEEQSLIDLFFEFVRISIYSETGFEKEVEALLF